ncbi:MAG: hypothetical protein COB98_09690 [Flavobacteriaceae bacterium]|nr:MAG: hypothetical protein COB98_09690 [Flavobacteriaceae bacterium]
MVRIYKNRIIVANISDQTIRNYLRGNVKLEGFLDKAPKELELDKVMCFLVFLEDDKGLNQKKGCGQTIKHSLQIIENTHRAILNTGACNQPALPATRR